MVKPFLPSFLRRGTLYPLRVKSVAVQHAMLVGFLALLCPHKEVHLRYVKNLKGVQGEFLYKPQDKLTILYYNKKLDTEENEGDNYVRNLLF